MRLPPCNVILDPSGQAVKVEILLDSDKLAAVMRLVG